MLAREGKTRQISFYSEGRKRQSSFGDEGEAAFFLIDISAGIYIFFINTIQKEFCRRGQL
jgi:hypothetical protein